MSKELTKEELREWRSNETTKKILFELRQVRLIISKSLENGETLRNGCGTGEETGKAIGILYGIDLILDINIDNYKGN